MHDNNVCSAIKHNIDIAAYVEQCGLHLVPHGGKGYLRTQEHDSLIIMPYGKGGNEPYGTFSWNSRETGGSIIDFAMEYHGLSENDAISHLRGFLNSKEQYVLKRSPRPATKTAVAVNTSFTIPEKSSSGYKRLFGYLVQARCIDKEIVQKAVNNKQIYQDARGNVCFCGQDYDGKIAYAAMRTTASNVQFRGEAAGSKKEVGFTHNLVGHSPTQLFVTEAPIECFSIMTMLKLHNRDYEQYAYLSLGGTADNALMYHVSKHPQLQRVYLCQNNDEAGHKSRAACRAALEQAGFRGRIQDKPPIKKDFNDDLRVLVESSLEPQQQTFTIERGIQHER